MPKTVDSPVKRWPGMVTLVDPPNFDQLIGWQDAVEAAQEFTEPGEPGKRLITNNLRYTRALLPGVLTMVEKWDLGGGFPAQPTPSTFPSVPIRSAIRLLQAINAAVAEIVAQTDDLPND